MEVETRGETEAVGNYMLDEAIRITKAAADMHHVSCDIDYVGVTEPFTCSKEVIPLVQKAAEGSKYIKEILPEANVSGSEDCSFMVNRVQKNGGIATYMLFGTRLDYPHHHPAFDFEEEVLPVAVDTFTRVAEEVHANE